MATIEAFCRFDEEGLDRIARTGGAAERVRARVLAAWAAFDPMLYQDHAALAAQAAIKAEPECYRVYADYYDTSRDVGDGHKSTELPLKLFSMKVPSRLKGMKSLPESVRSVLEASRGEMAVVKAIEAENEAHPGGSELPWAVLSRWMREERFLQVLHRTEFMVKRWSVPVGEFLQEYGALVQDHPFLVAIEAVYRRPEAKAYQQFEADDPQAIELPVLFLMLQSDQGKYGYLYEHAYSCVDDTYDQLVRMARVVSEAGEFVAGIRGMQISPYAPLGPATMVENGALKPGQPEEWLKTHADQPMVMSELGVLFEKHKDLEHAAEAFELAIKKSHDTFAYEKLAGIYKAQGRRDEWKRTLDEALKSTPDQGLKHARMQVEIAEDLMASGHAAEAKPYADAAAETWAGWAMQCAVRCHEKLEEWDEADLWMGRLSERYPSQLFDWYYWCLRTGHGNVVDAQTFTMDAISAMDMGSASDETRGMAVLLCMLAHENRRAIRILDLDFPKPGLYLQGLYLGLFGDEVGDQETRKRGWTGIPEGDAAVSGLAALFLDAVEKEEKEGLDLEAVDALLKEAPAKRQADLSYFVGRFLQRRGKSEEARRYLEQAKDNPAAFSFIQLAATCALREGP